MGALVESTRPVSVESPAAGEEIQIEAPRQDRLVIRTLSGKVVGDQ
jgi:hypothetical protein